jgi:membrane fusion protein (multidrug efflux system)
MSANQEQLPASAAQEKPASPGTAGPATQTAHPARARVMGLLVLFFALAGLSWFAYWHFFLRLEESTDNAYVSGNQVRVSSRIEGSVSAIFADNTDAVAAGQVLVRLDPADAAIALDRARASFADAVRQTRSLMIESKRLESLLTLRREELNKAEGDFLRRQDRKTTLAVSEEELSHARDNLAIARASLQVAEEELRRNHSLLLDCPLEEQPLVMLQAQQLREAWLKFKRCEVKSPVHGYVARRTVQPGMHVTPGLPLMAVLPLDEVWVDANFKEVQLTRMRIGQKALIRTDMYGGAVIYSGTVVGFSPGTGSSFSLLPPENATGNWIKVVQRIPVRIALDADSLAQFPLLVGLSCTVRVDVSNTSGPMLAPARDETTPLLQTDALEHDPAVIEAEIQAIIRANAL